MLNNIILNKYKNAMIINLGEDEILFTRYGKSNDRFFKAELKDEKAIVISLDGFPFEELS